VSDAVVPPGAGPRRLGIRGVIEGFYGAPWTADKRARMVADLGRWGMNRFVYAPKHDPHHRARWRDPYPDAEALALRELAAVARRAGVELVYALHPGLDLVAAAEPDAAALAGKLRGVHALGIRRFALLFDDIEYGLSDARDRAAWGEGPAGSGRAHGSVAARVEAEVLAPLGLAGTLLVAPTDYAGSGPSEYREGLSQTLPAGAGVLWTGDDVVVGEVTEQHVRGASAAFGGRPLVLWDNFPVNDFDLSRLFAGPLVGRSAGLPAAGLAGILANPMVQAEPSRFALRTVAEWADDPAAYDAARAAERALREVAGAEADALRPLVAAASSWPPSRPQHPALSAAVAASFDAGRATPALADLLAELSALAALPPASPLSRALRPWALAAAGTASVVERALAHAAGDETADAVASAWEELRVARHGIARDVARAAAERALGRDLPAPVRVDAGVPEEQVSAEA
jgi:hypothetical protein